MRALFLAPLALAACSTAAINPASEPATDTPGFYLPEGAELPLFGLGYRANGDQCRNVGENEYTVELLDDSADLVACPADMENLGLFAAETGGIEVGRGGGYVLYSVPSTFSAPAL